MDTDFQLLQKAFLSAPSDIQKLLQSGEAAKVVIDIAERHQVGDSLNLLVEEITFVMVGIEHPGDFIKNLAANLHISEEKARAIAGEVNEKIFRSVRESLKKVHHLGKYDESVEEDESDKEAPGSKPAQAPATPSVSLSAQDLLKQRLGGFFIFPEKGRVPGIVPTPKSEAQMSAPAAHADTPPLSHTPPVPPPAPAQTPTPLAANITVTAQPVLATPAVPPIPSVKPTASTISPIPRTAPVQPVPQAPQPLPAPPTPTPAQTTPAPPIKKMFDPYREVIE